jgi:hypothetical protein
MSSPFQLDRAASFRSLGGTVTCNSSHLSPSIHSCPGPHEAIPTKPVDDLLPRSHEASMVVWCMSDYSVFWTTTFSLCRQPTGEVNCKHRRMSDLFYCIEAMRDLLVVRLTFVVVVVLNKTDFMICM